MAVEEVYAILLGIVRKLETADEFMLSRNHYRIRMDELYYEQFITKIELIYLPLEDTFFEKSIEEELQQLTKALLEKMDPEIELENDIEDLVQYLNESYFSVEGFGKMLYRQSRNLPLFEEETMVRTAKKPISNITKSTKNAQEPIENSLKNFLNKIGLINNNSGISEKETITMSDEQKTAKEKLKKDSIVLVVLGILTSFVIYQLVPDSFVTAAVAFLIGTIILNYIHKKRTAFNQEFPELAIKKQEIKEPRTVEDELVFRKMKRNKIATIVIALLVIVAFQQLIQDVTLLGCFILLVLAKAFFYIRKITRQGTTQEVETNKTGKSFMKNKHATVGEPKKRISDLFNNEEGTSKKILIETSPSLIKNGMEAQERMPEIKKEEEETLPNDYRNQLKEELREEFKAEFTEEIHKKVAQEWLDKVEETKVKEEHPKKIQTNSKIETKISNILKNKLSYENSDPLLKLTRSENGDNLREIAIHKKHVLIGRNEKRVDYLENGKGTSRIHFELFYLDGTVMIRDLNSKQGTFLNGFRLQPYEMYEIKEQDQIKLKAVNYILKEIQVCS
ncbi:hypothetical protein CKN73_05200 [Carnobacterium divergens]|uniref:FHA domain-containing protein n=1 Tax=Carnobacterium divergens TaxID=2748 RepID=UPI0010716019|nr:FHA domain-containing protein [Carnobacterium divergens]TFJ41855.1 hypothetical protein CKN77_05325 [Carnobacterium divergens]TFJ50754.1 hypothetical protein CKN73_05200 [Carnobacterium divergens]TFJ55330.1 hypothetical protein CKN83_05130 [Carnobacterium divergens]TFJ62469.1 hypothetical protein CKN89_05220 [Carnobacterium divergens]TFJ72525.1 hypothetical protein CKN91_05135 [Carnobacterium divergens]